MAVTPPIERFWRHVDKTATCWLWTGMSGGTKSRYGYFRNTTKQTDPKVLAHRWIYEQTVGPIPEGMELDHKCQEPLCVRPDHLEPVSPTENSRRARLATCRSGRHDLTKPENMAWDEKGRRRGCLPCRKEREKGRTRRWSP